MTQVILARVDSAALWIEARRLIEEYAASLDFDLAFQDFDRELQSLDVDYAPPSGAFVLARHEGKWIGCGGVRRFSESACEMKRLYVSPFGRGRGAGRLIAEALIGAARCLGYRTMLLDTTPSMTRAQQIYSSLGFTVAAPYRYNPIEGASYWRLDLLAR
jgi:GNAT superfamily N-acetyltransferase